MNDEINLKTKDWDNYYVLIDFDRTLTDGNSTSSWEILSKGGFMPEEYVLEVNKLYEYYRPFEVDVNISNNGLFFLYVLFFFYLWHQLVLHIFYLFLFLLQQIHILLCLLL